MSSEKYKMSIKNYESERILLLSSKYNITQSFRFCDDNKSGLISL